MLRLVQVERSTDLHPFARPALQQCQRVAEIIPLLTAPPSAHSHTSSQGVVAGLWPFRSLPVINGDCKSAERTWEMSTATFPSSCAREGGGGHPDFMLIWHAGAPCRPNGRCE